MNIIYNCQSNCQWLVFQAKALILGKESLEDKGDLGEVLFMELCFRS